MLKIKIKVMRNVVESEDDINLWVGKDILYIDAVSKVNFDEIQIELIPTFTITEPPVSGTNPFFRVASIEDIMTVKRFKKVFKVCI